MSDIQLSGKVGIEIELLAPPGASRETLANALAEVYQGNVRRFFHPQSELSKIPNIPVMDNLTLGFEVLDAQGQPLAWCVDDLTLQDDCDRTAPPKPGWYRIVSDDQRLLKLISRLANPTAPITEVLDPIAALWGTVPQIAANGMVKVEDGDTAPIAIAAPSPGERERPCELITPPWSSQDLTKLDELLSIVQKLGFSVPAEGATHFHFDAQPLCHARVFKNLVNLLWTHGADLRNLVGANPRCRRLGGLPAALVELVQQPGWELLPWTAAVEQLRTLQLTKYSDFNLKNVVYAPAHKHTFEARIFPVWLTAPPFYRAIRLMESVLQRAHALEPVPFRPPSTGTPSAIEKFLAELPLSDTLYQDWRGCIGHRTRRG